MRVYVDFNGMISNTEIGLEFVGTHRDLSRHRVRLQEGMKLTVYDDADGDSEMEMEGIARYQPATDNQRGYWYAELDPGSFPRVDIQRTEPTPIDFPCFHCGVDIYEWRCSQGRNESATCPHCGGLVNEATRAPDP